MNRLQFVPSSIFLIMALFWVQTSPAGNTSSDAELALLKKELAELKREYASRFMRLESKIAALEDGEGDSTNQSPGVADSPGLDPGTTSTGPEKKLVIPLTAEKDVNPANSDGVKQPAPPAKTSNATVTKVDPHEYAYEGYVRSGFGINGKRGDMEPFKAPGSEAKYRLGNEGETYGEAALIHNYLDTSGPTFKTQIRIGYQSKNHMDYDVDNDTFILRKAFTQMANFT